MSLAWRSSRSISISGTTFCSIQLAGQRRSRDRAAGSQRFGAALRFSLLALQHVDVLRELAHARLEHAALGLDRVRRSLRRARRGSHGCRGPATSASRRATRAAMAPRRSRTSPNCEANLVSSMRISGWPSRTMAPSCTRMSRDDAAFERLHDLDLPRRDDAAVAALDLVEHGEMRPDQRRPRAARASRTAACARCAACAARPRRGCRWRTRNQTGALDVPAWRVRRLQACRTRQHCEDLVARAVGDQRPRSNTSRRSTSRQQRRPMRRDDDRHVAGRRAPSAARGIRPRCARRNARSARRGTGSSGLRIRMRARPMACFWPPDRLRPPSAIGMS